MLVIAILWPHAVAAQTVEASSPRRVIEEIIVTAQKTEESALDVPISMSVIDGALLIERSITDYRDLVLHTPNAHVDTGNGFFPDVNIRGYGSALQNKAFEQSVGLVVDGVPYGRTPYFQAPLFDVDRVELLRGPQGTLFGKNTTAGALSVVTNRPTGELSGFLQFDLGELERRRFEAAIGGPVVSNLLEVRVSALSEERDGLIANTTAAVEPDANERMNDRERRALRIQLGLPDVAGARVVLGYERMEFDFAGVGWEFDRVLERVRPYYFAFDPDTDFDSGNHRGSVDAEEFNRNELNVFVANASYALREWRVDAVASRSLLETRSFYDDDFGPAPMIFHRTDDEGPQTTFELRLRSPHLAGFLGIQNLFGLSLGNTEWLAGFFYQRRELRDDEVFLSVDLPLLAQFIVVNSAPPGTPTPLLEDLIGASVPIGDLGLFDTRELLASTLMVFNETSRTLAGFGSLRWQIADRLELQSGMRVTGERKVGDWRRSYNTTGNFYVALGGEEFTAHRTRSELAYTPQASLRFAWTEDVNLYASWARGFKAGGFNDFTHTNSDEALEFAPEKASATELGAKAALLDRALALNVALFRHDVTDFQVLTLPPNSVAATVRNAGEARAQGVEADATWLATDWLTLLATLGFNDSEFLDYPLGQCSFDRPDTDGNGDGACDHTGRPLFRTPEWTATLGGNIRVPVTSLPLLPLEGVDFVAGGTAEYQDVQYLDRTYDERVRQSPFFRFGASLGLDDRDRGWSARLIVENLTDEDTSVLIRDVLFGGGNFAKLAEPQRLIFATFRWAF